MATAINDMLSTFASAVTGTEDDPPTVMLTYGGAAGGIGKPGSFDTPKEWFGFKKQCMSMTSSEAFQQLIPESEQMKPAIVKTFPVPQFKGSTIEYLAGCEIDEIKRLDNEMTAPNQPDKVARIKELMTPNEDSQSFESQGDQYYLFGPFSSRASLMDALKQDPMLQPVHDKWSKFDAGALDKAFEFGTLFLQIRWQGWFVRPVLEMNREQLEKLLYAVPVPVATIAEAAPSSLMTQDTGTKTATETSNQSAEPLDPVSIAIPPSDGDSLPDTNDDHMEDLSDTGLSTPVQGQELLGRWSYETHEYEIKESDGKLNFVQIVGGDMIEGELASEGEWMVATLKKWHGSHGTLRIRLQAGNAISNWKPDGQDWLPDVVATNVDVVQAVQKTEATPYPLHEAGSSMSFQELKAMYEEAVRLYDIKAKEVKSLTARLTEEEQPSEASHDVQSAPALSINEDGRLWEESNECSNCKIRLVRFARPTHHCRACWKAVCGSCSTSTVKVSDKMHRICDMCVSTRFECLPA